MSKITIQRILLLKIFTRNVSQNSNLYVQTIKFQHISQKLFNLKSKREKSSKRLKKLIRTNMLDMLLQIILMKRHFRQNKALKNFIHFKEEEFILSNILLLSESPNQLRGCIPMVFWFHLSKSIISHWTNLSNFQSYYIIKRMKETRYFLLCRLNQKEIQKIWF